MNATPILLVPGLNATARVFAGQIETLWRHGPVTIANHTRGGSVAEIAASILADAPPRFALVGFSMGGYVALEMMRQARERVLRLALLDSSARPDTPEQSEKRRAQVELARGGKLELVSSQQFPNVVHPSHAADGALKAVHLGMARELGPEVFARHQQAIIGRQEAHGETRAQQAVRHERQQDQLADDGC